MAQKPKIRTSCLYRVHTPLAIRASGLWVPAGVVADLGDIEDGMLRWLLDSGGIETADPEAGEPVFNVATGAVDRPPCPCDK